MMKTMCYSVCESVSAHVIVCDMIAVDDETTFTQGRSQSSSVAAG